MQTDGLAMFRTDAPEEDFCGKARNLDDLSRTRFVAGRTARGGALQQRLDAGGVR